MSLLGLYLFQFCLPEGLLCIKMAENKKYWYMGNNFVSGGFFWQLLSCRDNMRKCIAQINACQFWHILGPKFGQLHILYLLNRYFSYRQIKSVRDGHSAPIEKQSKIFAITLHKHIILCVLALLVMCQHRKTWRRWWTISNIVPI